LPSLLRTLLLYHIPKNMNFSALGDRKNHEKAEGLQFFLWVINSHTNRKINTLKSSLYTNLQHSKQYYSLKSNLDISKTFPQQNSTVNSHHSFTFPQRFPQHIFKSSASKPNPTLLSFAKNNLHKLAQ